MNKEERMHRLLGDIDDDLVADAARKPIRKAVWVPAVAAAACVALAVGLWQGGVFSPADIPVETPDVSTTTAEATEPSKDATTTTAEPTEPSKADPSKSEPTKTTTTTTKPYILVGGEDNYESIQNNSEPSLKDRLVSPALEEKMKEHRDVNTVFQVEVYAAFTVEDNEEYDTFLENNEEYQSLLKQYKEAKKAKNKASDRLHQSRVNNDDPEIQAALTEEFLKAEEVFNDLSHKCHVMGDELFKKFTTSLEKERISYAAKYSKTEPVYGYGRFGNGYYMELTADAINELSNRGGYIFKLAGEKIDLSEPVDH